jgi:hypothetical protein
MKIIRLYRYHIEKKNYIQKQILESIFKEKFYCHNLIINHAVGVYYSFPLISFANTNTNSCTMILTFTGLIKFKHPREIVSCSD